MARLTPWRTLTLAQVTLAQVTLAAVALVQMTLTQATLGTLTPRTRPPRKAPACKSPSLQHDETLRPPAACTTLPSQPSCYEPFPLTARTLFQASCVAIDGRGILIAGPPGSGKSSLTLALLDRGAQLVGDDGVILSRTNTGLTATPVPEIAGLLEIRNVGLVQVEALGSATIALMIRLSPDAPRYVEHAPREQIFGVEIPSISLWPDSPVLALRAEWALKTHGLNG